MTWTDHSVNEPAIGRYPDRHFDCLGRAEIMSLTSQPKVERCVAMVVSSGFETLLDDLLTSLSINGKCQDALLIVFSMNADAECQQITTNHSAIFVPYKPLGRVNATIKSILYSVARVVDAQKFLCLDTDLLVLDDLRPIFNALDGCSERSILACREGNDSHYGTLEQALNSLYHSRLSDVEELLGIYKDELAYPLVVNDGVFAGSRKAMLALDNIIRAMSGAITWVDERHDIWWRNQFIFNLALARLQCGVELNACYNIQLHTQDIQLNLEDGRIQFVWHEQPVHALHFNGNGRYKHSKLRNLIVSSPDSSVGTENGKVQIRTSDIPLISCIMPTRNRRAFVKQAIAYFEREDYPNRELIIVDDGDDRVFDLIPTDPRVRYIALNRQTSIGAKRNIACSEARGAIIAHWDDDDWYAPHRLRYQVAPLLDNKADMTGLVTGCFFDVTNWQGWLCTPELHRHLFTGDVHGGTLLYWRRLWENLSHYLPLSLAEDALFLRQVCQLGARLYKLPNANSFVYIRHGSNAWKFPLGTHLQPAGWKSTNVNLFLPPTDLPFYRALSEDSTSTWVPRVSFTQHLPDHVVSGKKNGVPLVSCIMPTYNRRKFIMQSISYFLQQDYPNKELIIIDDGTDAVSDLIPVDKCVRYIRLKERATIGSKRNLACEQAHGSIIVHWDDDDWHAPYQLRYQVGSILHEGTDLCGTCTLLYYDIVNQRAWQYIYPNILEQRMWLSGSTLCYRRSFWSNNRFVNVNVGEDARFVWGGSRKRSTILKDVTFHVGMIHEQNVSPKKTEGAFWKPYPVEEIRRLIGNDWAYYRQNMVLVKIPQKET